MTQKTITIWLDEKTYKAFRIKAMVVGKTIKEILLPVIKEFIHAKQK